MKVVNLLNNERTKAMLDI